MDSVSIRRLAIAVIVSIAVFVAYVAYQQISEIRRIRSPVVIHSEEKNSPYSTIDGTTIRIHPYDATFEIPQTWLTLKPASDDHVKNLYLTWAELNAVNRIDREPGGFDTEDADVINTVLPFEDCVAHVGDRGWGNGLWNDIQSRIYITDFTVEEIESRLKIDGLNIAKANFEEASLSQSKYEEWKRHTFEILDAPTHFMLFKRLDFNIRPIGNKTVVFVFLHAGGFDKEINLLLDSFSWGK